MGSSIYSVTRYIYIDIFGNSYYIFISLYLSSISHSFPLTEGAAAKPLQQQSKAGDAVAKAMTTNPIDLSEATQILNVEFGITKEEFDEVRVFVFGKI